MFNIKNLSIEDSATMEVRDAAGKVVEVNGEAISITFHGPGSKPFRRAKHAFDQKRSNSITAMMTGKDDAKRDEDDEDKDIAEFLAACTISLNGFEYPGKAGYEGMKALYADPKLGHIAAAANKFLGDRANFWLPKSPASSDSSGIQLG